MSTDYSAVCDKHKESCHFGHAGLGAGDRLTVDNDDSPLERWLCRHLVDYDGEDACVIRIVVDDALLNGYLHTCSDGTVIYIK